MDFHKYFTYLSSVSGGEDPHGSTALFHIPEEPQGRYLVGFRGHIHVDEQRGEATNSTEREKNNKEIIFVGVHVWNGLDPAA